MRRIVGITQSFELFRTWGGTQWSRARTKGLGLNARAANTMESHRSCSDLLLVFRSQTEDFRALAAARSCQSTRSSPIARSRKLAHKHVIILVECSGRVYLKEQSLEIYRRMSVDFCAPSLQLVSFGLSFSSRVKCANP